jgi:hypothetical protein
LEKDLVQVRTGESSHKSSFSSLMTDMDYIYLRRLGCRKLRMRLFMFDILLQRSKVKLHGIHKGEDAGRKKFNAIFHEIDPLVWFNE